MFYYAITGLQSVGIYVVCGSGDALIGVDSMEGWDDVILCLYWHIVTTECTTAVGFGGSMVDHYLGGGFGGIHIDIHHTIFFHLGHLFPHNKFIHSPLWFLVLSSSLLVLGKQLFLPFLQFTRQLIIHPELFVSVKVLDMAKYYTFAFKGIELGNYRSCPVCILLAHPVHPVKLNLCQISIINFHLIFQEPSESLTTVCRRFIRVLFHIIKNKIVSHHSCLHLK